MSGWSKEYLSTFPEKLLFIFTFPGVNSWRTPRRRKSEAKAVRKMQILPQGHFLFFLILLIRLNKRVEMVILFRNTPNNSAQVRPAKLIRAVLGLVMLVCHGARTWLSLQASRLVNSMCRDNGAPEFHSTWKVKIFSYRHYPTISWRPEPNILNHVCALKAARVLSARSEGSQQRPIDWNNRLRGNKWIEILWSETLLLGNLRMANKLCGAPSIAII